MIQPILANETWLSFPLSTRVKLRELFNIPRSGHVEVFGQQVMCDGTMSEDLKELTIEKMQEYLHTTEDDFYKLLTRTVDEIENPHVADFGELRPMTEGEKELAKGLDEFFDKEDNKELEVKQKTNGKRKAHK